jgi:hypothetical protein
MSWGIRGSILGMAKTTYLNVKNGSGALVTSDSVVTKVSSPEVSCRFVKMTTHLRMAENKS